MVAPQVTATLGNGLLSPNHCMFFSHTDARSSPPTCFFAVVLKVIWKFQRLHAQNAQSSLPYNTDDDLVNSASRQPIEYSSRPQSPTFPSLFHISISVPASTPSSSTAPSIPFHMLTTLASLSASQDKLEKLSLATFHKSRFPYH